MRAWLLILLLVAACIAHVGPSPWEVAPAAEQAEWWAEISECWATFYPDRTSDLQLEDVEVWVVPNEVADSTWVPHPIKVDACLAGSIGCHRMTILLRHRLIFREGQESDEDTFKHEVLHALGAQHNDSVYDGYFVREECK